MDFSIVSEKSMSYADLAEIIESFRHDILKRFKYLYSYHGKGMAEDKVSHTFRFWLGLRERTLTGEDLNGFREEFLAYLERNGLELR